MPAHSQLLSNKNVVAASEAANVDARHEYHKLRMLQTSASNACIGQCNETQTMGHRHMARHNLQMTPVLLQETLKHCRAQSPEACASHIMGGPPEILRHLWMSQQCQLGRLWIEQTDRFDCSWWVLP